MGKLKYLLLLVLILPLVSADPYSDCTRYGNCKPVSTSTVFNNNSGNVNNSQYWAGYTPQSYNTSFIANAYVPYSGAIGNVNLNNRNITSIQRIGVNTFGTIPQIYADNDDNTGIVFEAPDVFSLYNGGTATVTLSSSNKVGIGTTAPTHSLTIGNSATALNVSGNLYVNTSNVGIGTSRPLNSLFINTSTANGAGITFVQSDGVGGTINADNAQLYVFGSNSSSAAFRVSASKIRMGDGAGSVSSIEMGTGRISNTGNSGGITFDGTENVVIGANNFTINTNGLFVNGNSKLVGIGTATPSMALDVRGAGNFSGTVFINNNTDISTFLTNVSSSYVPYTGALGNVDLNLKNLTNLDNIEGGNNFTNNGKNNIVLTTINLSSRATIGDTNSIILGRIIGHNSTISTSSAGSKFLLLTVDGANSSIVTISANSRSQIIQASLLGLNNTISLSNSNGLFMSIYLSGINSSISTGSINANFIKDYSLTTGTVRSYNGAGNFIISNGGGNIVTDTSSGSSFVRVNSIAGTRAYINNAGTFTNAFLSSTGAYAYNTGQGATILSGLNLSVSGQETIISGKNLNMTGTNSFGFGVATSPVVVPASNQFWTNAYLNVSNNASIMQNLGIGSVSTSYPLYVKGTNATQIVARFDGNISASGYHTTTDVFDKTENSNKTAVETLKDSSELYYLNGTINHRAFGYSYSPYKESYVLRYDKVTTKETVCQDKEVKNISGVVVIDEETNQPKLQNVCELVDIENQVPVFAEREVEAIDLVKEVAWMRQALYELKLENDKLKSDIILLKEKVK